MVKNTRENIIADKSVEALRIVSELSKYINKDIQTLSATQRTRFLHLSLEYKYLRADPDITQTLKKLEAQFNITTDFQKKISNAVKVSTSAKEKDEINYFRAMNEMALEEQRFKQNFAKLLATNPSAIFNDPDSAVRAAKMGVLKAGTQVVHPTYGKMDFSKFFLHSTEEMVKKSLTLLKQAKENREQRIVFALKINKLSEEKREELLKKLDLSIQKQIELDCQEVKKFSPDALSRFEQRYPNILSDKEINIVYNNRNKINGEVADIQNKATGAGEIGTTVIQHDNTCTKNQKEELNKGNQNASQVLLNVFSADEFDNLLNNSNKTVNQAASESLYNFKPQNQAVTEETVQNITGNNTLRNNSEPPTHDVAQSLKNHAHQDESKPLVIAQRDK